MPPIGGECPGGTSRMMAHGGGMSVVDEEEPAAGEFTGDGLRPWLEGRTDFRAEVRDSVRHGRRLAGERPFHKDKASAVIIDAALVPCAYVAGEKFDWESVEQLVGEENAGKGGQVVLVRHVGEMVRPGSEGLLLDGAKLGQRFDHDDPRGAARPGGEDVGHESAVVGALLDESEVIRVPEELPHFGKLGGEEFSEDGADVHVGEEVAATSGTVRPARIVTAVRMVKCDGHELVEADRSFLRDAAAEFFRGSVRAG